MSFSALGAEKLDKIIAYVNDDIITEMEVQQHIQMMRQALQQENSPTLTQVQLRKRAIDALIKTKLELQFAKQMKLSVTKAELDRAVVSIAKRNRMTVKQLYERLAADGLSRQQYRENLRQEMLISQVIQRMPGRDVSVSKEEVKTYLREQAKQRSNQVQYHLSRLLIPLPEGATTQETKRAQQRAQAVSKKLKDGVDFEQIALIASGMEHMDLGWRQFGELPPLFQRVKHMKTGEVAGPLRAQNGLQFIKLLAVRRDGNQQTLSTQQLEEQAYNVLYQRKLNTAAQKWLQEVQQQAYIRRIDPL